MRSSERAIVVSLLSCVAHHDRAIYAFGHEPQHYLHPFRFRLEIVEGGAFATAKNGVARLATQIWNILVFSSVGMMDHCMDALIRVPEVVTCRVQTGVTLRRIFLFSSPFALHLTPRLHLPVDPCRFQPYPATAMWTILR
jgi:hypothetical protein